MVESGECGTIYIRLDMMLVPVRGVDRLHAVVDANAPVPDCKRFVLYQALMAESGSCTTHRTAGWSGATHILIRTHKRCANSDFFSTTLFRRREALTTPSSQPTCTRRCACQATVVCSCCQSRAGYVHVCTSVLCPHTDGMTVQWAGICGHSPDAHVLTAESDGA